MYKRQADRTKLPFLENNLFDGIRKFIIQKIGGSGYKYTVSDAIVEENLQVKE